MKIVQSYAIKSVFRKVISSFLNQLNETYFSSLDPTDIPEVLCFLQGAVNHGLTWSQYNPDVVSDGTYAANPSSYQTLKVDIQSRCQQETFKRQLFRVLEDLSDEE